MRVVHASEGVEFAHGEYDELRMFSEREKDSIVRVKFYASFEQWCEINAHTPESSWTIRQYGNYIQGYRDSLPWAYSGMSLAYDKWAESRWQVIQDKKRLMLAWQRGLALKAKSYFQNIDTSWRERSLTDAVELMLIVWEES